MDKKISKTSTTKKAGVPLKNATGGGVGANKGRGCSTPKGTRKGITK